DLVFTADINNFNSKERLQLVLNDWRHAYEGVEHNSLNFVPPPAASAQSPGSPTSSPASPQGAAIEKLVHDIDLPLRDPVSSAKTVWKDLRRNEQPDEVLKRGVEKLGANMAVFAEACEAPKGMKFHDRLSLPQAKHLLIWQFPPSLDVFKEIIARTSADNL